MPTSNYVPPAAEPAALSTVTAPEAAMQPVGHPSAFGPDDDLSQIAHLEYLIRSATLSIGELEERVDVLTYRCVSVSVSALRNLISDCDEDIAALRLSLAGR